MALRVTVRKIPLIPFLLRSSKNLPANLCEIATLRMREFLRIKKCQWDEKKFSIIYHCPHCVSITNLQVYRSGQVYKFVDRGSHYPVVNVTWEEDGSVQIHITCHCNERIEFNRQGKSGSIQVLH